jgi:hypothetical protein
MRALPLPAAVYSSQCMQIQVSQGMKDLGGVVKSHPDWAGTPIRQCHKNSAQDLEGVLSTASN